MRITVITPTENRSKFLPGLYDSFKRQSWADRELIVLDTSDVEDIEFIGLTSEDPRVRYMHIPPVNGVALTLAQKRYKLVEAATGEFVAHFTDSDYYAPQYLQRHSENLRTGQLVTLRSWYSVQIPERFFAYWKTHILERTQFEVVGGKPITPFNPHGVITDFDTYLNIWGNSFSYMYDRSVALNLGFPAGYLPEGEEFFRELRAHGFASACYDDNEGLMLHFLHGDESRGIYPQYHLQNEMIVGVFGDAIVPFIKRSV